jgi:hypothetical protein
MKLLVETCFAGLQISLRLFSPTLIFCVCFCYSCPYLHLFFSCSFGRPVCLISGISCVCSYAEAYRVFSRPILNVIFYYAIAFRGLSANFWGGRNIIVFCVLCSHACDSRRFILQVCNAIRFGEYLTFLRNILPPPSGSNNEGNKEHRQEYEGITCCRKGLSWFSQILACFCFRVCLFDPEDGGVVLLRNTALFPICLALQARKSYFPTLVLELKQDGGRL